MKMELEMEKLRLELMMDASVLPPMQQEYIHQWQMEILEK